VGRDIWRSAAARAGAVVRAIEVTCSDASVHERRLANRRRELEPFPEPTWEAVVLRRREVEPWTQPRLVLDSLQPIEASVARALDFLAG
jgi:hypothetical protein